MGEEAQDAGTAVPVDAAEHRRQPALGQHPLQGPILEHPFGIADQIRDALDETVDRLGLGDAVLLGGEPLVDQHLTPGDRQGHQGHQDLPEGADHPLTQGPDRLPVPAAVDIEEGIQPAQGQGQGHGGHQQGERRQHPRRGPLIQPGADQPPEVGQQLQERQPQQHGAGRHRQQRQAGQQTHQGEGRGQNQL